ncbi:MAG: acyl carrier protein [Steroidobacteraceae bacterium]|nr:acyl carrier protein [Steroidobacteraceae bacterium]MDW8260047.1 acyl carrier protein [Gammaproteobacteria bacterium]
MELLPRIKLILGDALGLGARAEQLTSESRLLGEIPEFDSMAVVTVVTMIEEEFGITLEGDELTAQTFATLGTLSDLVSRKLLT